MIKLHENFKPKHNTITDNLKREMAEWIEHEKDDKIIEKVVASVVTGLPIFGLKPEEIDYSSKYKKETIKASLQNYVLDQLNHGVDNIPLFFFFDLEGFDKFSYSNFATSLSNYTLEVISSNLKKIF